MYRNRICHVASWGTEGNRRYNLIFSLSVSSKNKLTELGGGICQRRRQALRKMCLQKRSGWQRVSVAARASSAVGGNAV